MNGPDFLQIFARNPYDADVIDYEQTLNYSGLSNPSLFS